MLTNLGPDELVTLGSGLRLQALVAQARYTLGIAAQDGDRLPDYLPEGYLAATDEKRREVEALADEKGDAAAASREATEESRGTQHDGKMWCRRVERRILRARRIDKGLPLPPSRPGELGRQAHLIAHLGALLGYLKQNGAALDAATGGHAAALADEGELLREAVRSADQEQEVRLLSHLPQATRNLYRAKGELYVAIKTIHDAGRELHVADDAAAARYNLSILHRVPPTRPTPPPEA